VRLLAFVAALLIVGCAAKPVMHMPAEQIDIAMHCGLDHKDDDGCIVEDHDAFRVYVLTRKAMCGKDKQ
jgi:hypothetical protein